MRQPVIAIFLFVFVCIAACETKQPSESLTLVAFGPTDSVTKENKGFSARVYSFIDFGNDSVFVRDKSIYDSIATIKIGNLKKLIQNEYVNELMKILDSLENGVMVGKGKSFNDQYPELYCGWDIFVEHKKDGVSKWFYTSSYTIDPLINLITYILEEPSLIRNDSVHIDDDHLVAPIVSREGFVLNHLPPVRTIIKFLPPKVDSLENRKND